MLYRYASDLVVVPCLGRESGHQTHVAKMLLLSALDSFPTMQEWFVSPS